jgi:heme/copper-type cytochrome/quinol oxidase subunit 2
MIVHSHPIPMAEPIFWIAAVLCIAAQLLLLHSAFFPRGGSSESATIAHSPRGVEMIWAVIPAIALVFLLAATWRAVHHG